MKLNKNKDDWQKCCRWCHHYVEGKCYASPVDDNAELNIEMVSENGFLSEAIKETLNDGQMSHFNELFSQLRDWKLSDKRIKEFRKLFSELYENWVDCFLTQELDEKITICYNNHVFDYTDKGRYIEDPENYCCNRWC